VFFRQFHIFLSLVTFKTRFLRDNLEYITSFCPRTFNQFQNNPRSRRFEKAKAQANVPSERRFVFLEASDLSMGWLTAPNSPAKFYVFGTLSFRGLIVCSDGEFFNSSKTVVTRHTFEASYCLFLSCSFKDNAAIFRSPPAVASSTLSSETPRSQSKYIKLLVGRLHERCGRRGTSRHVVDGVLPPEQDKAAL
jgi:hypothetical protein